MHHHLLLGACLSLACLSGVHKAFLKPLQVNPDTLPHAVTRTLHSHPRTHSPTHTLPHPPTHPHTHTHAHTLPTHTLTQLLAHTSSLAHTSRKTNKGQDKRNTNGGSESTKMTEYLCTFFTILHIAQRTATQTNTRISLPHSLAFVFADLLTPQVCVNVAACFIFLCCFH